MLLHVTRKVSYLCVVGIEKARRDVPDMACHFELCVLQAVWSVAACKFSFGHAKDLRVLSRPKMVIDMKRAIRLKSTSSQLETANVVHNLPLPFEHFELR
jgi:hypothetical protein